MNFSLGRHLPSFCTGFIILHDLRLATYVCFCVWLGATPIAPITNGISGCTLGIVLISLLLMVCISASGLPLFTVTRSPCVQVVFQTGERIWVSHRHAVTPLYSYHLHGKIIGSIITTIVHCHHRLDAFGSTIVFLWIIPPTVTDMLNYTPLMPWLARPYRMKAEMLQDDDFVMKHQFCIPSTMAYLR